MVELVTENCSKSSLFAFAAAKQRLPPSRHENRALSHKVVNSHSLHCNLALPLPRTWKSPREPRRGRLFGPHECDVGLDLSIISPPPHTPLIHVCLPMNVPSRRDRRWKRVCPMSGKELMLEEGFQRRMSSRVSRR